MLKFLCYFLVLPGYFQRMFSSEFYLITAYLGLQAVLLNPKATVLTLSIQNDLWLLELGARSVSWVVILSSAAQAKGLCCTCFMSGRNSAVVLKPCVCRFQCF